MLEELTEEERKDITQNDYEFVMIRGKSYFVKKISKDYRTGQYLNFFKEVIAKKVALLFSISCPNYFPVKIGEDYYYLSEDLNSFGEFVEGSDIVGYTTSSLYQIWNCFEEFYKDVPRLMRQMIQIYVYDILLLNHDRKPRNWGVVKSEKENVYIFDNEYIFNLQVFSFLTVSYDRADLIYDFDYYKEVRRELTQFFKDSSKEFVDIFLSSFFKLTPEKLKKIINEIEDDYVVKLPEEYLSIYTAHYEVIKQILIDLNLINEKKERYYVR